MRNFAVKDFMTASPHAIEPHESAEKAFQRMRDLKVLHMPVRARGLAVGILSERDVALLSTLPGQHRVDLKTMQVSEVMTPDPYCVKPDAPLRNVAADMARSKIGSALVIDDAGVLLGIFTVSDALRALSTVV